MIYHRLSLRMPHRTSITGRRGHPPSNESNHPTHPMNQTTRISQGAVPCRGRDAPWEHGNRGAQLAAGGGSNLARKGRESVEEGHAGACANDPLLGAAAAAAGETPHEQGLSSEGSGPLQGGREVACTHEGSPISSPECICVLYNGRYYRILISVCK